MFKDSARSAIVCACAATPNAQTETARAVEIECFTSVAGRMGPSSIVLSSDRTLGDSTGRVKRSARPQSQPQRTPEAKPTPGQAWQLSQTNSPRLPALERVSVVPQRRQSSFSRPNTQKPLLKLFLAKSGMRDTRNPRSHGNPLRGMMHLKKKFLSSLSYSEPSREPSIL